MPKKNSFKPYIPNNPGYKPSFNNLTQTEYNEINMPTMDPFVFMKGIGQLIDPTGITSWPDIYNARNKEELILASLSAIPMIGKWGKLAKTGSKQAKKLAEQQFLLNSTQVGLDVSQVLNNDFQNGGNNKKLLPSDYQKFLEYNKTAPENRQAAANWEYGNPRDYDHYGMWDALGKPNNFNEAVKNNPDWQPDQYDNSYHGFSVNPNNGVWLKSHIPGEYQPGSTAWMENMAFQLMPGPDGPMNKSLIFDSNIQRMRYIDKNKKEKGGIGSLSASSTYTFTPPSVTPPMYKGMPLYNNAHDTDALMQLATKGNQVDPVTYMAYHKLLNENNKPPINYNPKSKQAWYNPLNSALNVHSPKGIIEELSHAHQDMKLPGIVPLWLAADFIKQPFFTKEGQKQTYHKKHTMENNAHSVVEPQLRKRFNVISDSLKQVQKKGMPIFGGGGGSDIGIQFNPNMLGNLQNVQPQSIGMPDYSNWLGNFQNAQPKVIGMPDYSHLFGYGNIANNTQQQQKQSKLGWGNYASMGVGAFNGLAAFINNGKNNREERKQLQMNMQQPTWQATDDYRYGLNNEPMMFQNGGSYTVKKGDTLTTIAKKMGVPIEKLISENKIKNPDVILPGAVIKVQGLPFGDPRANGLVETGEAIEFNTGQYGVVDTKGPFNQDHGDSYDGTYLPGVQRVLENTSSKRKGIEDQILKLTPDQVLDTTGYKPARGLSHAQAFEQAVDFHSNKALKIINKNNKLMERKNLSMAEKNALDLNNVFMSMMPTQDKIFDSLFQDQESVKQQFGISDSGEPISKQQFGGIPKAKNGKDNQLKQIQAEMHAIAKDPYYMMNPDKKKKYLELYRAAQTLTPPLISYDASKNYQGANPIVGTTKKTTIVPPINRKQTNFMNAVVGNPANPLLPSNIRPRTTTPKVNINPVTNLPINSVASVSSMDFGSFTGPYGNDKPEMYGDQAYWDNVYEDARLNMNMPGFNNVETLSPHSQYQRFVSSQMPTQLVDAFRNGEMRLTNKHLDIAKQLGIQPSELNDQQLLEGFNDGKKEIRAIRQQTVNFDNQADANNATKGYRSLDVNGNPQYVDDTFPNDSEHPLSYYNFNGPAPVTNQMSEFDKMITGMNTFKPLADAPSTPAGVPESTYTKPVNPFSPASKEPKSNNIDLKWYDYMSPLNGLIDSMQRDPENLFRANVNQLQSKLIDPTNQVNAITSQIRPAIKDMSNDSVGQAAKMQLLTNAARTKADILSTADNTNSQIMNNQIQYNTGVRDKQSLMDATANQDFANRVLQSKAKQSDNYKEAIDKFGNLFSSNAQLNNMVDLLKTKNFDLDASTMGISFLNNAGNLIPNSSKPPIYQYDAQGNMKPKKNNPNAAYIKQLMSSTDPRDIAILQLLKQQMAAANQ